MSPPSVTPPLIDLMPSAWRSPLERRLAPGTLEALGTRFDAACAEGPVCPPRDRLFAALDAVAPSDVRVVLLGQDPYPTAGVANGLAFSTSPSARLPASLRRLYEGLRRDVGTAPPTGDLSGWAAQGILLLNTVLSVRAGEPNSHRDLGWEPVCRAMVELVAEGPAPVVFLCLGRQAEGLVEALSPPPRHPRIVAPHPSPLTGKRFLEACEQTRPFSAVNRALEAAGHPPIDWGRAAPGPSPA